MLKLIKKIFATKPAQNVSSKDEELDEDDYTMYSPRFSDRTYDPYSSGNPYRYNPGDKSSYAELIREVSVVEPLFGDDMVDPFYYDDVEI